MPIRKLSANPRLLTFVAAAVILAGLIAAVAVNSKPVLGKITLDTRPAGGAVMIEGHYCPAAPCDFELAPGEYHAEASLPNYHHAEATVDVPANGAAYRTLHLLPMVPTPEEATRMGLIQRPDAKDGPIDLSKRRAKR